MHSKTHSAHTNNNYPYKNSSTNMYGNVEVRDIWSVMTTLSSSRANATLLESRSTLSPKASGHHVCLGCILLDCYLDGTPSIGWLPSSWLRHSTTSTSVVLTHAKTAPNRYGEGRFCLRHPPMVIIITQCPFQLCGNSRGLAKLTLSITNGKSNPDASAGAIEA